MPTERSGTGGTNAELLRRKFNDYLSIMAYGDVVLVHETENLDNDNNVTGISTTTEGIRGDLQFATYADIQVLGPGVITMGDGIFYCVYSENLKEFDKIRAAGIDWELTKQVEAEQIENQEVYQAWVCKRRM